MSEWCGRPSVRTVLLKAFDPRGFVFFTNYRSRKGREIGETRRASLLFYWSSLERQVRIDGSVQAVSDGESDAYFATQITATGTGANEACLLALEPLGLALIGPLAAGIGTSTTLWVTAAVVFSCQLAVILVPSVRRLEYRPNATGPPLPAISASPRSYAEVASATRA